jgi:signal transduction histidine kinase
MRSLRTALIGLGLAGLAAGIGALALVEASDHLDSVQTEGVVFTPLIGWAFIGTGLFAWWRRPENRLGALMTAVGFVWFGSTLIASDNPTLFAIGGIVNAIPYALFLHLLVAFPTGRLQTRWERFLIGLAYFDTTVMVVLTNLFLDTTDPDVCTGCPANPLMISDQPTVYSILLGVQALIGIFGLTAVASLLIRRWRTASPTARRAFTPVLIAGTLAAFFLGLSLLGDITGVPDGTPEDVIDVLGATAMAAVPFGFLFGLLRSRLSRADAVSELIGRLGEVGRRQDLRDAIAQALGDPSLSLAYWVPDLGRYVDADGQPVEIPARSGPTACTPVTHDGEPVAMICHDPELAAESELVEAVGAAAGLALENQRLNVELRAHVEELRASRARIVEAADEERRRLERDLHDGAQQRLVSLALNLRLARGKLDSDPDGARELIDQTAEELGEATTELRELARGLHPAVLSDRGLRPALEALAGRAPVPVELELGAATERLPVPVETASYFVVAEALTNMARYADASQARVSILRDNGTVEVEVADDGVGGAEAGAGAGSGLRGLADRVAALDGRLEISSPAGEGTTIRAVIPCA